MGKIRFPVLSLYVPSGTHVPGLPMSAELIARYSVVPLRIYTPDGEKIYIDRVTDVRRMASMKAGGLGDRYTCVATMGEVQRTIYLYKDGDEIYMEDEF